jgi:hypothetical protein
MQGGTWYAAHTNRDLAAAPPWQVSFEHAESFWVLNCARWRSCLTSAVHGADADAKVARDPRPGRGLFSCIERQPNRSAPFS